MKNTEKLLITEKNFPNGFVSWTDTFYLMGREIDGIEGYGEIVRTLGSTWFFTEVPKWADEFETLNKDREWDGEFEDEVVDFLTEKIKAELWK